MIWQFLTILLLFAILDLVDKKIPNLAVIPAIGAGIYLTGNWFPALVIFCIGALIYQQEYWRGGDVKLLTLVGAFLGFIAIPILVVTFALIKLFRFTRDYHLALPVAPFFFVATTGILGLLTFVRIPNP